MKQIQLLGDDLDYIFENFRPNPIQVKKYPKPKRGKRLTHGMMSQDHPKALRLYFGEDEDGELVGSLKRCSAERFWQYNDSSHVFAPLPDLIRLGVFCHLDFYHGIALGLKGLWERFYAKESKSSGGSLVEMLTDYDNAKAVSEKFEPTCAELYELVNRYKRYEQAWEEELRYYTEANFCKA